MKLNLSKNKNVWRELSSAYTTFYSPMWRSRSLLCLAVLCLNLLGFSACSDGEKEEIISSGSDLYVLKAVVEGHDAEVSARTAVGENGQVTWVSSDVLGVFGEKTQNAPFRSGGNGGEVTFSGQLSEGETQALWAYYPYTSEAIVQDKQLTLNLPDEYDYTGENQAPMLARPNSENVFQFKHLGGLLRITLGGDMPADADRFVIRSVAGNDAQSASPIAGLASVADISAEFPVLQLVPSESASSTVTYRLEGLKERMKSGEYQHFFVPLPVGTYPKLEVSFYVSGQSGQSENLSTSSAASDGSGKPDASAGLVFTRTISNLTVERAKMISMPVLNWSNGQAYKLNEGTKEITDELALQVEPVADQPSQLFWKSKQSEELPKIGQVVWSPANQTLPNGFLGKVKKVTKQGDGTYLVETGPAALTEVFDELYINETVELEPLDEPAARSRAEGTTEVFDHEIKVEHAIKKGDKQQPMFLKGNLGMGFKLTTVIDLNKWKKVQRASFVLSTAFNWSMDLGIHGTFVKEDAVREKLFEKKFKNIPLAYGLVQVTPVITPYFNVDISGTMKNEAGFGLESVMYACAEYKDGQWRNGSFRKRKAKDKSPWDFRGSLTFEGKDFFALSVEGAFRLYGREDLQVALEPELGVEVAGSVKIDDKNSESLEKILRSLKLSTTLKGKGKLKLDASIFQPESEGVKSEIDLPEVNFGSRDIYLLPFFEDLLAQMKPNPESQLKSEAEIKSTMSREMMSKETKVALVVEDSEEKLVEESPQQPYTGSPENQEIEEDQPVAPAAEPEPVELKTEKVEAGQSYKAYPVVYSPLLEDIVPEGRLELRDLEVSFGQVEGSLREQLIRLYNETDGPNWDGNQNWCSDEPIETWLGVEKLEDGLYRLNFNGRGLKGVLRLSHAQVKEVELLENPQLTGIVLNGCEQLTKLRYDSRVVEHVELAGCHELEFTLPKPFHMDAAVKYLDLTGCVKVAQPRGWNANMPHIETLILKDLPELEELPYLSSEALHLRKLDVSGCVKLQWVVPYGAPLEILNVNGCQSLQWDIYASFPGTLKELRAADGALKGAFWMDGRFEQLKVLRLEHNPQLMNVSIDCKQLDSLSLKGCTAIDTLLLRNCSFADIGLEDPARLKKLLLQNCPNIPQWNVPMKKLEYLSLHGTAWTSVVAYDKLVRLDVRSESSIEEIALSNATSLQVLDASFTSVSKLDVSACTQLKKLDCSFTKIADLDVTKNLELQELACRRNGLPELQVNHLLKLERLECDENQLVELEVSALKALKNLSCFGNQLTTLDLTSSVTLEELNCGSNRLEQLKLAPNAPLKDLYCGENQLKEVDVHLYPMLQTLGVHQNPLEVLNISGTQLTDFPLKDVSNLHTLEVRNCSKLEQIQVSHSKLVSLDLTGCNLLKEVNCSFTPSLETIILSESSNGQLQKLNLYGTRTSGQIDSWMKFIKFYHEKRYKYSEQLDEDGNWVNVFEDKGYGWWYPGEPDSHTHQPNW